jgi:4-amino-4-deoxy-L-arabinose transferase-like glycosyltransferase
VSRRIDPTIAVAAGLTALFAVISAWWVAVDRGVPVFDNGTHLYYSFQVRDAVANGDVLFPFTTFNNYPPLVHIVGAIGAAIGGVHIAPPVIAQNLVFLPVLVAGCYGTGRLAYGRLAGLLAVVFALGTPMLISQLHGFLVDAPEAAMVAVSVWAILASRRFSRIGIAAGAGALCGLGMLTKETFPIFVAGLIFVALQRGGWRNWRGLLAFGAALVVVGFPWYLGHLGDLRDLGNSYIGSTGGSGGVVRAGLLGQRLSSKSLGYYFWDLVNLQLLVPLAALAIAGTVICGTRFLRRRDPADLTPELVVGGLCAYLGETYAVVKDPRYTLPALVYLAVLGTGWIPLLRARWRIAAIAVLGVVVVLNTAAGSFGVGHDVRVAFAGGPPGSRLHERGFTLYAPSIGGAPQRRPDVQAIMRGLRARGIRVVDFDAGSANVPAFNLQGLRALARIVGLSQPRVYDPGRLGPSDAFMLRHAPVAGDPPPCTRFADGTGLYIELGNPLKPFTSYTFVCPGRRPAVYRRTAPLPGSITPQSSTRLLRLMRALRRSGVRVIEFDVGSGQAPDFGIQALTALAGRAGLQRPASYNPAALGPHDAFLLHHVPRPGDPAPCVRLSDGAGAYVVLGNPLIPFDQYHFVCPTRARTP